ncbi:hypothetical protein CCYS_09860 [Corynebacterium cystitidis DSM 20524]|uniref:Very-short-patch-repair endonuclease n=2 Tax=Corynebacterium cystitidis TaxID=35757 RepID=A0A1H9VN64_9CORY|nr:hypothetical protein CCYS_09860 [Corynebacterium cystitidis DSM 20524]SES23145.1 Very-short-patch-repair endonuclease [Corynebacterium cystitidis DSM 20524]SNV69424.1 Uncharacterised protein [Corynebacterium cystitidis]
MKIYSREELRTHLGIGERAFRSRLQSGEITKLDHGFYALGSFTGQEFAQALLQIHPTWVLTGVSAYQFHNRAPLTFPLHFRAPRNTRSRSSAHFQVKAHRYPVSSRFGQFTVVPPIVAAWDAHDEISAHDLVDFLEDAYAFKSGKRNLDLHLSWMGHVPVGLREYISTLSIGTDSNLERKFLRALKRRGFEFDQNVVVGPYRWDFRSKRFSRLLIEIGAYKYHRDLSTAEGEKGHVHDSWKLNYAALNGFVVLQFTARCIDNELERCLDMVEDSMRVLEGGKPQRKWKPAWRWHSWIQRLNRRRIA